MREHVCDGMTKLEIVDVIEEAHKKSFPHVGFSRIKAIRKRRTELQRLYGLAKSILATGDSQ